MTRAMWICTDYTIADGVRGAHTPADALGGFGSFLSRVAAAVEPDGVVLLDHCVVEHFGLDAASLSVARLAGWTVAGDEWQPWTTFRRPARDGREHRLHVGLLPRLTVDRFPLLAPTAAQTVRRLVRWHHLAGAGYHGTPGVAGVEILRAIKVRTRGAPLWRTGGAWLPTIPHTAETDYSLRQWSRPAESISPRDGIGYDVNRMYLAAAGVALLARGDLQHTGRAEFDPRRAGYWLAELSPWQWLDRLPDPAGYAPRSGSIRWVTTPTLRLLSELLDAGHYAGFTVHDSWTAPASRITEQWSTTLNGMCQHWHEIADDPDGPAAVRATAKAAYRETIGLFDVPRGTIHRPDWRHTIIATARVNLWRRLWQYGADRGVWPLGIDVDCAYFGSPVDLPVGGQLGQFKHITKGKAA